jgi:hypothetical protein
MEKLENLEYVELYLDSKDAVESNLNVSSTDWPFFSLTRPLYNVEYVKLLEAEIPFSYYVINSTNQTFTLTEPLVGSVTVLLHPGNYTAATMASHLATQLTTASTSLGNRSYTVTFSTLTHKFTITTNFDEFILTFGTATNNGETNPRYVLGMNSGNNQSILGTLQSAFTTQITGPNYLYLCSDFLSKNIETTVPQGYIGGGIKGPQIAKIPINCNPGEVVFYTDPAPQKWFSAQNLYQIQSLDLYCRLGNYEEKIRFNGQNFSIKLGALIRKK